MPVPTKAAPVAMATHRPMVNAVAPCWDAVAPSLTILEPGAGASPEAVAHRASLQSGDGRGTGPGCASARPMLNISAAQSETKVAALRRCLTMAPSSSGGRPGVKAPERLVSLRPNASVTKQSHRRGRVSPTNSEGFTCQPNTTEQARARPWNRRAC